MRLLRLSSSVRLSLLAVASWVVLGTPTKVMADTFANISGVPSCTTGSSNATPAIATCGSLALGGTGGFASANFNLLGASAFSSNFGNVTSLAQFADTVTFAPAGTGSGFLGFRENLSGSITGTGSGATAFGKFSVSYNDTVGCVVQASQNGAAVDACFAFVPILFGTSQQITIQGTLTVNAKFGGAGDEADFSHTAQITDVNLYDSNKNLIGPIDLTGDSGTVYGRVPQTPEPSSLLLFATGLVGLTGKLRPKRRS